MLQVTVTPHCWIHSSIAIVGGQLDEPPYLHFGMSSCVVPFRLWAESVWSHRSRVAVLWSRPRWDEIFAAEADRPQQCRAASQVVDLPYGGNQLEFHTRWTYFGL